MASYTANKRFGFFFMFIFCYTCPLPPTFIYLCVYIYIYTRTVLYTPIIFFVSRQTIHRVRQKPTPSALCPLYVICSWTHVRDIFFIIISLLFFFFFFYIVIMRRVFVRASSTRHLSVYIRVCHGALQKARGEGPPPHTHRVIIIYYNIAEERKKG